MQYSGSRGWRLCLARQTSMFCFHFKQHTSTKFADQKEQFKLAAQQLQQHLGTPSHACCKLAPTYRTEAISPRELVYAE